jgi:hypothetical protein
MFERPVIGPLRIVGKAASGKLAAFQVIAQTFATYPLARTGIISTVA